MQEILLKDLIDVQVLQKIQNGFSKFSGMAALTTDAQGNPITEGSGFTDFCMNLTRTSEEGFKRCAECDRQGALLTLEKGKAAVYYCHAGLVDFAAPIMVEGTVVGSFIGGQVLTDSYKEEEIRNTAAELGIDSDAYVEAVKKVNQVELERAEQAAEFLSVIAEVLSQMAYNNYISLEQSKLAERTSRSHSNYIVDMNDNMKQHVKAWLDTARELGNSATDKQEEILSKLFSKGEEFLSTIEDTVDFSQMSNGEMELEESEYSIKDVLNYTKHIVHEDLKIHSNQMKIEIDDSVPKLLLGDSARINQVITRLVRNTNSYAKNSKILVSVSVSKRSYASDLVIRVSDDCGGLSEDEFVKEKAYLEEGVPIADGEKASVSILPLMISKMSGKIWMEGNPGKSTTYAVRIPQLAV